MSSWLKSILRFQHWYQTTAKVAEFEGITLSDLKRKSDDFRKTIVSALVLVRDTDARRFRRVRNHVEWIVNCTLDEPAAEYHADFKSVRIDFDDPTDDSDAEYIIGFWARTLVHEATHGFLIDRGIEYTEELRSRVERLCVKEENRFILRLSVTHPQLATRLQREFDEIEWQFAWTATPRERIRALFRRILKS